MPSRPTLDNCQAAEKREKEKRLNIRRRDKLTETESWEEQRNRKRENTLTRESFLKNLKRKA